DAVRAAAAWPSPRRQSSRAEKRRGSCARSVRKPARRASPRGWGTVSGPCPFGRPKVALLYNRGDLRSRPGARSGDRAPTGGQRGFVPRSRFELISPARSGGAETLQEMRRRVALAQRREMDATTVGLHEV